MSNLNQKLGQYAELIVKVGVNVQQGQEVFLTSAIEMAPLARLIVDRSYEAGASNVHVDWTDEALSRLNTKKQPMRSSLHSPSGKLPSATLL